MAKEEEPQQVASVQERLQLIKEYHDTPFTGYYGAELMFLKLLGKCYFPDMRKLCKTCEECQRYKICNLKPPGLLKTSSANTRFEVIAVDLIGPLPTTKNVWLLAVEDTASKWVELFALKKATAEECELVLVREIATRYGVPRRVIRDNGVQFTSDIVQYIT